MLTKKPNGMLHKPEFKKHYDNFRMMFKPNRSFFRLQDREQYVIEVDNQNCRIIIQNDKLKAVIEYKAPVTGEIYFAKDGIKWDSADLHKLRNFVGLYKQRYNILI